MAQRFGGKFSPSATANPVDAPAAASKVGFRANFLFIAPLPLVLTSFTGGADQFPFRLTGLALLLLGAWLTREGLKAEEAYEARKVAKRPAAPRKILGAAAIGLGLFAAGMGSNGMIGGVVLGLAAAALHLFSFGLDPLRDKGIAGADAYQTDRVARAVERGEENLRQMGELIAGLGDRKLTDRIAQFQNTARQMFRTVEEDPRDLTQARKFIGVYLQGARDATDKFASLYARKRDTDTRADFETLLDDLESNFTAKTETLLNDNRSDMDIEIKVLRDRLAREGLQSEEEEKA